MDRSSLDAAVSLLARSERGILVVSAADPPADTFCGLMGLTLALEGLGKTAAVLCPTHVPPSLQFLPGTSQVSDTIQQSPELHVELPLRGQRPGHVHWEMVGDTLRITVHPEGDIPFSETPVNVQRGGYPWDLIATVGVPRLHTLGDLFTRHTRFFYDTPILNIDRGTDNEFFGTVNLVPAVAGTISEVVHDLLETAGGTNLLTPPVSTCLLAGCVAGTDSFRAPTTSPRLLELAGRLIALEADHAAVVRHLFHTHTRGALRLLGLALTRLEELPSGLLLTTLTPDDFQESGSTPDLTPAVLHELLEWAGERRPTALAFERARGTLEALLSLGRVSPDDREAFRASVNGSLVGPLILVNLGSGASGDARQLVEEQIVPRLPSASGKA